MTLTQQADRLIARAKKIAEEKNRVKAKLDSLEAEKNDWRSKAEKNAREMTELSENIKIIKLAQNIGSENRQNDAVADLKRKINEYIKEIDTCIAMLNEYDEREK